MSRTKKNHFSVLLSIFSDKERAEIKRVQIWPLVTGVVSGLCLFSIIALGSSFASRQPVWGLSFPAWLLVLLLLSVLTMLLTYLGNVKKYNMVLGLLGSTYASIGNHVARLPIGAFSSQDPGKYSRVVSQELMNLGQFLGEGSTGLVQNMVSMLVITVCAWLWLWPVGLLLSVGICLTIVLNWAAHKLQTKMSPAIEAAESTCASRIVEYANCQGALRACHVGDRFAPLQDSLAAVHSLRKRNLFWDTLGLVVQGVGDINIPLIMAGFSLYLMSTGALDAITALLLICLSLRLYQMMSNITVATSTLNAATGAVNMLIELYSREPLREPAVSAPTTCPGQLELEHVDFAYQPGKPILRDVSFTVPAGSMCALVGPSGCGKTTVARLIARFYDASAGEVRVGGTPVENLSTKDLMQQISIVFQDVYLFNDSLRANVLMAKPDATEAELAWAADLSGVSEIIERLPQGWDSIAGEGGHSLSGGERQRISIARALLKQAPIVLFDEATSALDAENEAHIVQAMEVLRAQSTLMVIAHKLETIQAADQIVVLSHEGSVIQRGTHTELVAVPGAYRNFWQKRIDAEGWSLV